jgi:hypothetical protein
VVLLFGCLLSIRRWKYLALLLVVLLGRWRRLLPACVPHAALLLVLQPAVVPWRTTCVSGVDDDPVFAYRNGLKRKSVRGTCALGRQPQRSPAAGWLLLLAAAVVVPPVRHSFRASRKELWAAASSKLPRSKAPPPPRGSGACSTDPPAAACPT